MGGCGMRCMKYLLFVFNFIIWLGGAALIALGAILYLGLQKWIPVYEIADLLNNDDDLLEYSSFILIGAGAVIFLMAFCGCCGAITECRYLLVIYFIVLVILFCTQIAAGIMASVYSMDLEEALNENMIAGFRLTYGNETREKALTEAWRLGEASLDCCGYNGGEDYDADESDNVYSLYKIADIDKKDPNFPDFPESCCVGASFSKYKADNPAGCRTSWNNDMTMDTTTYHGKGCRDTLSDLIVEYINWIRCGAIGLAGVELICMLFAICVCRKIEDD